VIELAYQSDRRNKNLRPIFTRRVGKDLIEVKTLGEEELNPMDLAEAHEYARIPNRKQDALKYKEVDPLRSEPEFDEERVFNAVYTQARKAQEHVESWTELPVRIATEIYHNEMSRINYDDLYDLQSPSNDSCPLLKFKRRFHNQVRNLGLLWYRVVFHHALIPLKDGIYNESDLLVSPYLPFTTPHLLRDCGIKVIFASFSDPQPVSSEIYQQQLASWLAKWELDTQKRRSAKEQDAIRIRNYAGVMARHDLTQSLAQIFEREAGNDEIIALHILQTLEEMAANSKIQSLVSNETISLMNGLRNCILLGNTNKDEINGLLPVSKNQSSGQVGGSGDFNIINDVSSNPTLPDNNIPSLPSRKLVQ
jgi:hypothetical protein